MHETLRERHVSGLVRGTAPLTLLVAPAGYGKTTLLAQAADAFPGRVLRWRPSRDTLGVPSLLARLGQQLGLADPVSVEAVLLAVERCTEPVLLIVDGVHHVHGSPAEAVLEELALLAPPNLRLILAGRRMPALNLTRLELAETPAISSGELRLSEDEIIAAYPEAPEAARELAELTKGRPGVLRLSGPAVLAGRDPLESAALRTYLDREVLGALPSRLERLLEGAALDVPDGPELREIAEEYGMEADVPLLRAHLARRRELSARRTSTPKHRCTSPAAPLSLRCFRRYEATLAGRPLDWGRTRPRVRALARLLSVHAGQPVHREELMAALWPESNSRTAGRGLQVAVSALRTVLEPGSDCASPATPLGRKGRAQVLVRSGEAYMLVLEPGGTCDVRSFEAAAGEGLRAAAHGDAERAARSLEQAMRLYTGELLPEDGPAEWVVPIRERYRARAVTVAHTLAEVELGRGRADAAVVAATLALTLDVFQDAVWRLLVAAHRQAGDPVAARHAERRHAKMLESLDLL